MRHLVFFLILLYPFSLYSFERDGWPEEGIPVMAYKLSEYKIYSHPDEKSEYQTWKMPKGERINFIKSKYITIKPVIMKVTQDIQIENYFTDCGGKDILLKKGDVIINFQYWAEGDYAVEIQGKNVQCHCQMNFQNFKSSLTNSADEPVADWWIQIQNKTQDKGWLKVTKENILFHDREL